MSRSNLKLLTLLLFSVLVGASIFVLASTMNISEASKNRDVPGVLIGDIGEQKIIERDGWPVLILKKSNSEFIVWDLKPKFSNEKKASCSIIQLNPSKTNEASFTELCSGTQYSSDGKVFGFGHPSALPMEKLNWSIKGAYLVVSKNT